MEAVPRIRVLCVDDNQDTAESEATLLRLVGMESRPCYDGPSAVEAARDFVPDVCLIDLNMPGMDGDELAGMLREEAGGRPVLLVAVTARSDEDARRRTRAAGFDLHLVKPVNPHDLLRILNELGHLLNAAASAAVTRRPG